MLAISPMVTAKTYYVAINGNDSNVGTIGAPWGTWQKAFETANAGDTVYFREGVWYPETTEFQNAIYLIDPTAAYQFGVKRGHSGTANNPICYFNYPGETPVLDCSKVTATGNYLEAISLNENVSYIHFKGLEIRNVWQKSFGIQVNGISTNMCSNITFENMSIHDIGGRGMWLTSVVGYYGTIQDSTGNQWDCEDHTCLDTIYAIPTDTSRVINCDFYNCADTLMPHQFNLGDGIKGDLEKGGVFIIDGCRFWNCSDDGIDLSGSGQKILKNCWAFQNGVNFMSIYVPDDGNGFKLGAVRDSIEIPNWIMSNCISAGNQRFAIHELDFNDYRNNARVYNSIFYKNEEGPTSFRNANKPFHNTEFYNSISYGNTARQVLINDYPYPESHNTWDWIYGESVCYEMTDTVTVTDDDFMSVDINELASPRKADGSLPDVNFMHLAVGSDLIDAGTTTTLSGVLIGIPYSGSAPDIGAFETNKQSGLSQKYKTDLRFTVFPSPVDEVAYFQFIGYNSGVYSIEIVNLMGAIVFKTATDQIAIGANQKEVNLSALKQGIYQCRLMDNEQVISTLKFLKNLK